MPPILTQSAYAKAYPPAPPAALRRVPVRRPAPAPARVVPRAAARPTPRPTPRAAPRAAAGLNINSILANYFGGSVMSPEQIRKTARQQVDDALTETTRGFDKERARAEEQARNDQMTQATFAMALAGMRGDHAGEISDAWRGAAGNMQSFANALGADVTGQQSGALAAGNQAVDAMGLPGDVTAPNPANTAAVTSYVAGKLPADVYGARATAEYQQALARGDAVGARYWDNMIAAGFVGKQAQSDLASKKMEIEAQRPKLLREAEAALRGEARQDLATLMSALTLQNTFDNTGSLITSRTKSATTAGKQAQTSAKNAATTRAKVTGVLPNGQMAPGFYRNPATGKVAKIPAGYVADPGSATGLKKMPAGNAPKGDKAGVPKAPSLTDWQKTRETMLDQGRTRLGLVGFSVPKRWSKAQIRRYLMTQVGNDFVATYGQRKRVEQIVSEAANTLWNETQERVKSKGKRK